MSRSESTGPTPASSAPPGAGLSDDDAVALIAAAVEAVWPRPVIVTGGQEDATPAWRFSGRWWAQPLPLRRDRPWRA